MVTTKNICIWGDSIAYGAWDSAGGWVDRLRRFLHERAMASGFREYFWVYNLGIPGETTNEILRRFSAEREARTPHIVIFTAGINDSSRLGTTAANRVSLERFEENVRRLIAAALESAETVIWVGISVIDETTVLAEKNIAADFRDTHARAYEATLARVCRELRVPFLEMIHVLNSDDLLDGLHPNADGHRKMFECVRDFLVSQGVL